MPGPHIQLAAICEKVLQEADGVLSVIRVIDRVILTAQGSELPAELPQGLRANLTFVVALRADDAQGRHPLRVRIQQPSGLYLPEQSFDVMFESGERGVNLILQLQIEALEGLYWFEVAVNDQTLTRVPLRVMYQRMQTNV